MRFIGLRLVSSFAFVPLMTMSLPGNLPQDKAPENGAQAVSSSIFSKGLLAFNKTVDQENVDAELQKEREEKAAMIDAYFASKGMPLKGYGLKMVLEAEKNDLDWRILPAISVRESTGGKHACKSVSNSPFGWGSCKISFKTMDESIETVARNLGGNNPRTAHHYDDKTTLQILRAYNPPSIVPKYAEQVIAIMNAIGPIENNAQVATTI